MTGRAGEAVVVAAGLAYLAVLSWSMTNMSFDIWGALVLIPIYGVLGVAGLRGMFRGELRPLVWVMSWGLLFKLGGALARYWVGFEAYGGGIDAGEYHRIASEHAGAIWAGDVSVFEAVPTGTGTQFLENFTGFAYTLTGGSQLAGFVTFSFLAYWGLAFMVKAAAVAIPDMAIRRYAWLCVLFPSIVYWPSSIGKEALMMLGLGVGTYGIAVMLTQHRWVTPLILIGVGLGFAAVIRPHMAGIWVAAALPALGLATVVGKPRAGAARRQGRLGLVAVVVIASIVLAVLATATVRFLQPPTHVDTVGDSGSLTAIFEETTRRTAQAGSQFTPPSVSSPIKWPYAVARTLTRPLPFEARGIAQLISAAEMAALLVLYAASWRRVKNVVPALFRNPYVLFVVTVLVLAGLAYSVFANLGVLARQKSLVVPFLLIAPCLPLTIRRKSDPADAHVVTNRNAAAASAVESVDRVATSQRQPTTTGHATLGALPSAASRMDELWD